LKRTIFALFLGVLICTSGNTFAQTINGIHISQLTAEYIEIVGTAKILKPMECIIHVDYGQISKMAEIQNGWVLDSSGNRMSFNGMMAVVNFFNQYGYALVDAYPITETSGLVYHYVMRKEN
jgi:hypothetical protein